MAHSPNPLQRIRTSPSAMNQNSTTLWSPMVFGPEDEFANFLEFSDLQHDFPFDDAFEEGGGMLPGADGAMENDMGLMASGEGNVQRHQQPHPQMDPCAMHPQTSSGLSDIRNSSTESLMGMNMGAQRFHERQKQYPLQYPRQDPYQRQGVVPPTPNSIEMHGGYPQFYHQADQHAQASYEHYARKHQDQVG